MEIKDNIVSNKELLVARSDKEYRKVYRWVWFVLKYKELYRSISRKTNDKQDTKETMDISDSWFLSQSYY